MIHPEDEVLELEADALLDPWLRPELLDQGQRDAVEPACQERKRQHERPALGIGEPVGVELGACGALKKGRPSHSTSAVEWRKCEAVKDSYLANGVQVAQVAALFEAARELWAAAPWNVILTDDSLLRVSCASLELKDAVISVIGQHREMFGFILFPEGLDAFTQFEKAARQGLAPMQTQVSLAFVARRDLSVHLRREVQKFRWPLPAEGLYPLATTVDRRGPRPASSAEVDRLEAIASMLIELVRIEPRLHDATFGTDSFEHTLDVSTFSGRRELQVSAPCIPPPDDGDEIVLVRRGSTKSSHDGNRSKRS